MIEAIQWSIEMREENHIIKKFCILFKIMCKKFYQKIFIDLLAPKTLLIILEKKIRAKLCPNFKRIPKA